MRLELDNSGWVDKVLFGCKSGICTNYNGTTPSGYASLEAWANTANVRAYKLVNNDNKFTVDKVVVLNNMRQKGLVFLQIQADTRTTLKWKLQKYQNNSYVGEIDSMTATTIGRVSMRFTKQSNYNQISLGLDGSQLDSKIIINISGLLDGSTYTISWYILNKNQGSISWNDIQIELGSTATSYKSGNLTYDSTRNTTLETEWKGCGPITGRNIKLTKTDFQSLTAMNLTQVTFGAATDTTNNKLTRNGNNIVIGAGVHSVLVKIQCSLLANVSGLLLIGVTRNGSDVGGCRRDFTNCTSFEVNDVFSVQEGDIIEFYIMVGSNTSIDKVTSNTFARATILG